MTRTRGYQQNQRSAQHWKTSQFKWVQVQEFGNMKAYREGEKRQMPQQGLLSIDKANEGHIEFCIFSSIEYCFRFGPHFEECSPSVAMR
jgi:hypothetical protein